MVKISNAFYENEIHSVDSPFNEGGPNFGGGTAGTFREMAKTAKPIVMQIRKWSILIGNTGLYSLVSKFLHCFCFQAKFCPKFCPPLPKVRDIFQI